jgi:hypothetical protein
MAALKATNAPVFLFRRPAVAPLAVVHAVYVVADSLQDVRRRSRAAVANYAEGIEAAAFRHSSS